MRGGKRRERRLERPASPPAPPLPFQRPPLPPSCVEKAARGRAARHVAAQRASGEGEGPRRPLWKRAIAGGGGWCPPGVRGGARPRPHHPHPRPVGLFSTASWGTAAAGVRRGCKHLPGARHPLGGQRAPLAARLCAASAGKPLPSLRESGPLA